MKTTSRLSRRAFIQSAAVAGVAASLEPGVPALGQAKAAALPYPENGTLVPDAGWRLWLDREATWAEDDIFLPEDVKWVDGRLCGGGKPLAVNAHAPHRRA